MKLRIIAAILCLLLLLPLVACTDTGNGSETTANTDDKADPGDTSDSIADQNQNVDANGYELDDLSDTLKIGKKINILYWSDATNMEFFPASETPNADEINDALITRNYNVESRLDVDLNFIAELGNDKNMTSFIQKVESDKTDGEYDIIASYSRAAATIATRGLSTDLSSLDNINLDKPWWPDSLVSEMTIGDSIYFCSGDISTNLLWMMEATFYNKEQITEYNLEDPMSLVLDDKWTFDKFFEMCEGKYAVNGGNEVYGCVLYNINIDAYQTSAGIFAVENDNGVLSLSESYSATSIVDLCDSFIKFFASGDVKTSTKTDIRDIFFEERALFTTDRVFIIYGKDSAAEKEYIQFDYGVVPNPKLNSKDPYYTNVGHPFTLYSIPNYISEDRRNNAAAVLECLASESYRNVTPELYERVMKLKYAPDTTTGKMFDLIKGNIVFEVGRIFNICSYYTASHFREVVLSGSNTWKTDLRRSKTIIEQDIEAINTALGG